MNALPAMNLAPGAKWNMLGPDGHRRVRILRVETAFVLVEHDGPKDEWGTGRREWVPRALFTRVPTLVYE